MKDLKENFDTEANSGSKKWYEDCIRNAVSMKSAYILLVLGSIILIGSVIALICGLIDDGKYIYWGIIVILLGNIHFERFEARRAIVRVMKRKNSEQEKSN